jgi:hypothetical protein
MAVGDLTSLSNYVFDAYGPVTEKTVEREARSTNATKKGNKHEEK